MNLFYSFGYVNLFRQIISQTSKSIKAVWDILLYSALLLSSPGALAANGVFTTPDSEMQIKDNQDFLVVLKNFSKTEAFPYLIFILWVLVICGGIGCLLKGNAEYNKTGDVGAALKSVALPAVMVCLGGILAWYVSSINESFDF
jgi:hypothetical protein